MDESFREQTSSESKSWEIFNGDGIPHDKIDTLPAPPKWRVKCPNHNYNNIERLPEDATIHAKIEVEKDEVDLVNAALYLRRPLLVTGKPGTGKSSLAEAIAHELKLGIVLSWPITTRSTLQEGLYHYDAISRAQAIASNDCTSIGDYIKLGPLGTALLPTKRPRVLLIDEIDKSDIDLPNDLLHVFELGFYEIKELLRLPPEKAKNVRVRPHDSRSISDVVSIGGGTVRCNTKAFPIVVLTSNGERDFPPAFLRRCIRLDVDVPKKEKLARIVKSYFPEEKNTKEQNERISALIEQFLEIQKKGDIATDQLLNAVFLATHHHLCPKDKLTEAILRTLSSKR